MLLVEGKQLGQKKALFEGFSVPAPGMSSQTLRSLIVHVVTQEVEAFHHRQVERRLVRALSWDKIEEGLAQGKVHSGGSNLDQKVDVEAAIQTAIEAFQDGLYLVVLDELELKDLDAAIELTEESRLTFIRLSLLAGG